MVSAAAGLAIAQDMTAIVTSASDSGLLAYTTITTACLPAVDPNNEPIFSIQTDTSIEPCTYVVNADNYSQIVSTIDASTTSASQSSTASSEVPLSTLVGTNTASMSGPPITTSTTIPTNSTAPTDESSTSQATTTAITSGNGNPAATFQPTETPAGGASGKMSVGGEAFGVVGLMAILAIL